MGKLVCLKCGATSLANTFEQADEQIDHSVGDSRGKPCIGSQLDITWDESFETDEDGNIIQSSPKPVASIVFHFGPGSKDYAPGARKSEAESVEPVDTDEPDAIDTEPVYEPNSSPKKKNKNQRNANN